MNSHRRIQEWERIYLEEGAEGFAVERRGRRSTGRPRRLPKEVEEDLLAEVQRLRAENDYLKTCKPWVLENERCQRKKRRVRLDAYGEYRLSDKDTEYPEELRGNTCIITVTAKKDDAE